jgi:hypothetical protein
VPGEQVTQLLGPRGPPLADHPRRLEAAAAAAAPLPQELGDRAVELLVQGLHRTRHPAVEGAHGDRVEDGPHRFPVTPADRGHPKRRRVDGADRGQHLHAVPVLPADPADDQRHRQASLPQVPYPGFQLRGSAAGHHLIVRAVPLRQLTLQDLPGGSLPADDDDGRLRPGSFTARGGSQPLMRRGGSAR